MPRRVRKSSIGSGRKRVRPRKRWMPSREALDGSQNYERWMRNGSQDTAARAGKIWKDKLETYEPPPLDEAIRAELEEYVVRRRAELGD